MTNLIYLTLKFAFYFHATERAIYNYFTILEKNLFEENFYSIIIIIDRILGTVGSLQLKTFMIHVSRIFEMKLKTIGEYAQAFSQLNFDSLTQYLEMRAIEKVNEAARKSLRRPILHQSFEMNLQR